MKKELIEYRFFRLIRDVARVLGYNNKFTIDGIRYEVDPCSVGKTPLGPIAGKFAVGRIRTNGKKELKILDIGCGVGIIGLTIFNRYKDSHEVSEIALADINFFNLNSLRRTLAINGLSKYQKEGRIKLFLSDVLKNIPESEKYDIIISNPPDFPIKSMTDINLSGTSLGRYSANHGFHKGFYKDCHKYLKANGEVWFIENRNAIPEEVVKDIVRSNENMNVLEFISVENSDIFWSIIGKRLS